MSIEPRNKRILLSLVLVIVWALVFAFAPNPQHSAAQRAVRQTDLTNASADAAQVVDFPVRNVTTVIVIGALVLLWVPRKRFWSYSVVAVMGILAMGACAPTRDIIIVESNEAAFVVPISGDTSAQGEVSPSDLNDPDQVFQTEIQVEKSWVANGGLFNTQGYWRPASRVFIVNLAPVTREYVVHPVNAGANKSVMALPVESAGSQGFAVPITLTASLLEVADTVAMVEATAEAGQDIVLETTTTQCASAAAYLRSYGRRVDQVDANNPRVEARPLSDVLDTEVRNAIGRELAARYATVNIEDAVLEKARILAEVQAVVVARFAPLGICITDFGTSDGLLYDNAEYQAQIDAAANRSADLEIARANATTTAQASMNEANSTQIAVQARSTQQFLERESLILQAGAYATATMIAGQAAAGVQDLNGQALADNPMLLQQQALQSWNGGCTSNCFGENNDVIPVYQIPVGTPSPNQ